MSLSPSFSLRTPPRPRLLRRITTSRNSIPVKNESFSPIPNGNSRTCLNGRRGCLVAVGCSTSSPLIGRVGLHKQEGNFTLLSFGADQKMAEEAGVKSDSSQVLSALLPVVVALTAVSALWKPWMFTWVSQELYAPALGGIMLSIGIKLSIEDFAFRRSSALKLR